MRIKLDDKYVLTNDETQYMLKEVSISNGEKTKGNEVEKIVGYYSKVEDALKRYYDLLIFKSDAETIPELLTDIRVAKRYIETLITAKTIWKRD